MTSSNRRAFFKTAGVGAAAVGVAALVRPTTTMAGAAAPTTGIAAAEASSAPAATGSMVAYIEDASSGRISVMVEGREVTVTDHQLVASLSRALKSSSSKA